MIHQASSDFRLILKFWDGPDKLFENIDRSPTAGTVVGLEDQNNTRPRFLNLQVSL